MRLGLSTYTFTWEVGVPGHEPLRPLSPVALIRRTRSLGLGLVQFADNLPLHQLREPELDRIAAEAEAQRVDLEFGTRGIGPHLRRYAQLAQRFGARFVRIVLDAGDDRPTVAEAVHRLSVFEAEFRQRGLQLAIENHDRFCVDEFAEIVARLGNWSGICLDTANSLGALEPPRTVVARLGPLAVNLHLKDFTIRRHSHQMGFEIEGTPAGSGLLNIPWLLAQLDSVSRTRTAVLELWTPPASTVEATVARETAWAATSLEYLRTQTHLQWK
jgi:sugar phosphate isomerase/epimerase